MCDTSLQPILALIGHPVAGNPSQYMFEKLFAHHALDSRFLSFDVVPDNLYAAMRGMQVLGMNGGVIAPLFGSAAVDCLDRVDERVRQVGAVDCWVREDNQCVGYNTIGPAIAELLGHRRVIEGAQVVLLGANATARAIAIELAAGRARSIAMAAGLPESDDCRELVQWMGSHYPETEWQQLGCCDEASEDEADDSDAPPAKSPKSMTASKRSNPIVVPNETTFLINTIGPEDDNDTLVQTHVHVDMTQVEQLIVVADCSLSTEFIDSLEESDQMEHPAITGLDMLIQRAALQFRLWTGSDPDAMIMRDVVEEYLDF